MNLAEEITTLDQFDALIETWGTIPGAKIPVPVELAKGIRDELVKVRAGEFELFDAVAFEEKKSDVRHAFARHVSGDAKKPQEFWGR